MSDCSTHAFDIPDAIDPQAARNASQLANKDQMDTKPMEIEPRGECSMDYPDNGVKAVRCSHCHEMFDGEFVIVYKDSDLVEYAWSFCANCGFEVTGGGVFHVGE